MAVNSDGRRRRRSKSERRELAIKALAMRRDGHTYDVIGEELGITLKAASRYVNDLLNERAVEGVDQYRATIEERYDDLTRHLRELLQNDDITVSHRLSALQQLASIEEKRVRLLGLAVPVKQVVELQKQDVWEDGYVE